MKYSIGINYDGTGIEFLQTIIPHINHLEIAPDSIATRQKGKVSIDAHAIEDIQWAYNAGDINLLIHGVGLSIGTYSGYSAEYIHLLDILFCNFPILWHSEHLAYTTVDGESLGTMLTLPRTDETVELICRRVDEIQKRYKAPFLLENVIDILPPSESKYSEPEFLNRIVDITGCGLLLDIYNLQCNEHNFGTDTAGLLSELNLSAIHELHLASGEKDIETDFQMDIHSQLLAPGTIELARRVTDLNPKNLKAITFEILHPFIAETGTENIIRQLQELNSVFNHDAIANTSEKYADAD